MTSESSLAKVRKVQDQLEKAILEMDLPALSRALSEGANANFQEPRESLNPLGTPLALVAARWGAPTAGLAIQALLEAGADPAVKPLGAWTPLMIAAINGNAEAAAALRGRGTDEEVDRNGDSAWMLAVKGVGPMGDVAGRHACFEWLAPSDVDSLEWAAKQARGNGEDAFARRIQARALAAREREQLERLDGEQGQAQSLGVEEGALGPNKGRGLCL
jgi:hypothetical protein